MYILSQVSFSRSTGGMPSERSGSGWMGGEIFVPGENFRAGTLRLSDKCTQMGSTGRLWTQNGSNLRSKFLLSVRIRDGTILGPISVRIRIGDIRVLFQSVVRASERIPKRREYAHVRYVC